MNTRDNRAPSVESAVLHECKNHLSVVVGYCEMLLGDLRADDPQRADLQEILKAGKAAMALLPRLVHPPDRS